jgi:hypothetical protein
MCIGDLEYIRDYLLLENYNSRTPCFLCGCNSTDVPWTACSLTADWWGKVHSDAQEWARGRTLNKLFQVTGLSAFNVYPDWMHTKHMGLDHYLYASVLSILGADGDWTWVWGQLRAKYEVYWKRQIMFIVSCLRNVTLA